jgi:hypothetical protein
MAKVQRAVDQYTERERERDTEDDVRVTTTHLKRLCINLNNLVAKRKRSF